MLISFKNTKKTIDLPSVYENSKKNPLSTYAKANYKAEHEIMLLKNKKFKVNALRNSTLFGSGL